MNFFQKGIIFKNTFWNLLYRTSKFSSKPQASMSTELVNSPVKLNSQSQYVNNHSLQCQGFFTALTFANTSWHLSGFNIKHIIYCIESVEEHMEIRFTNNFLKVISWSLKFNTCTDTNNLNMMYNQLWWFLSQLLCDLFLSNCMICLYL